MTFDLIAGNLALDFVATVAERTTTREEKLRSGEDLRVWLEQARVLDDPPPVSSAELARAVEVREALFSLVEALVAGGPVPPAVLRAVGEAAAAPPPRPRVTAGGALCWEGDLGAALSAIAREGLALLELDDPGSLRICADERCTRPFLDRSRGGRRRWCGMAGCGDRAKAAAYRRRRRAAGS